MWSSMLKLNLDLEELARQIAVDEGRNPEFLSIAERTWDFLLEHGYDPFLFSNEELDEINEHVDALVKKVEL